MYYSHDATKKKKQCSFEGCTNQKMKTHCSHVGCTNQVLEGGVCWTHGAKREWDAAWKGVPMESLKVDFVLLGALKVRKSCAALRDVVNLARKGGVCGTHVATRKSCSFEGIPARVLITTRLYRRLYSLVVT